MKKITREDRAALQSVRAKARKALAVNAPITKTVQNHLQAVIDFVDGKLAAKAKPEAETTEETTPEAIAA